MATMLGNVAMQIAELLSLVPGGWGMTVINILLWPIGLLGLGVAIYMLVRLVAAPFYSVLVRSRTREAWSSCRPAFSTAAMAAIDPADASRQRT